MPFPRRVSSNWIVLCILACLTVLPQTGCAPKKVPVPAWEKEAQVLLDQAQGQLSRHQYEQATKTVEAFRYRYPSSMYQDRALYLLGEIRFTLRDYPRAAKYFEELIQGFPASSYILQAKYRLGQCYFELKQYDLAIANLEDRSGITDPAKLLRISEMLSVAYMAKNDYVHAVSELAYLAGAAQSEQQRAGYRDRVREIIDQKLTEDELRNLASGTAYPADLARLRLAALLIDHRNFKEAIEVAKDFLETYPTHPEKTRAEMLLNEATSKLSSPRYYLGALLPETGRLAFFGDRVLRGVQLALHTYNQQNPDERVELIVKDTGGSPEKAASELRELAAEGVLAVIGPLLTKEAEAVVPELAALQVPVITPAASGEDIGKLSPWLFRNALTNSAQAVTAARYAVDRRLKKFVIMYPDDAYGKDLVRLFTKDLGQNAEILASVAYPPDARDFGPWIRKVMEIDLRSRKVVIPADPDERKQLFEEYTPGFDALYLPGYAEKVGLLIPQLAFYNISGIAMIGSNGWHSRDLIDRGQRYVEGAVFVDGFFPESKDPAIEAVVDAYRSAYQEDMGILAAQAYDAASMVLSLLREHKDTPPEVHEGLLTLKDFPGITGTTSFDGTGEARKKLFLITIHDGKFILDTGAFREPAALPGTP